MFTFVEVNFNTYFPYCTWCLVRARICLANRIQETNDPDPLFVFDSESRIRNPAAEGIICKRKSMYFSPFTIKQILKRLGGQLHNISDVYMYMTFFKVKFTTQGIFSPTIFLLHLTDLRGCLRGYSAILK